MYVTHWSQCCSNVSVFIAHHLGLDNLTWSLCLEKTDLLLSLACNYLVWDLMKFSLSILACPFMWSLHWSSSDKHIIELRQVHHPVRTRRHHPAAAILVLFLFIFPALVYNAPQVLGVELDFRCTNWDWTHYGHLLSAFLAHCRSL